MRYLGVLVLVGACSSSSARAADAKPIDAPPDAFDPCANVQVDGCVFNGLAGLPFDGTTPWTLTGTSTTYGQQTPITETLYLLRNGCELTVSSTSPSIVDGGLPITDTSAGYSDSGELPHPHSMSVGMCRSTADNTIHYGLRASQTMPALDYTIVGIVTY